MILRSMEERNVDIFCCSSSLGKGIGILKKSLFDITIYGLGEQRGKSGSAAAANERLYPPLRGFWDCFWTQKGLKLPESEFRTLTSFGQSG